MGSLWNTVVENLDEIKVKSVNFMSLLIDATNDIDFKQCDNVYSAFYHDLMSPMVKFVKNIPLYNCDDDSIATVTE